MKFLKNPFRKKRKSYFEKNGKRLEKFAKRVSGRLGAAWEKEKEKLSEQQDIERKAKLLKQLERQKSK